MISPLDYDELVKYREPHSPGDNNERFIMLRDRRYIKMCGWRTVHIGGIGDVQAPDKWVITETGKDALLEFERERDKHTQEEQDRRFNRKIAIAQVLVPLVTFFAGLIVEYYVGIISWVTRLFH